ncbi:cytochrome c peroxidase domain protein [Helicobacter pylori Hp A-17]|nr:cytochrome c peroxidase domain protein [Helicobacter pylori Hp A-17]
MKKSILLGVCLAFSCVYALSDMDLIKKAKESFVLFLMLF